MNNSENTPVQLGRPVNENSARQIRLKEIAAKREAGLIKRGRPAVEGSKHQMKMYERNFKIQQGIELKRGRPSNPESARAKRLADLAARKANGTFKLGRPKMNVEVEVPAEVKAVKKTKVVAE